MATEQTDALPVDRARLRALPLLLGQRARTFVEASWRGVVPFGALILLCIVFSIWTPTFLTFNNMVNIASQSAVLLIIAIGAAFIIVMGSIDLSVGAVASIAGIMAAKAADQYGAFALVVAVLVGAGCGLGNGLIFTALRIPSFLVTLGTMSIVTGLGLIITNSIPINVTNGAFLNIASYDFHTIPVLVVWALGVYLLSLLLASRTRFGRFIYAIGGGERVALVSGVPIMRYKIYAFILSGLLAGLAGGLLASWGGSGGPDIGQSYMLSAIAAVVMGGIPLTGGYGGIGRALLGVLVIGVLSNGLNLAGVGAYGQTVAQGLVIIVAVAFSLDRSKLSVLK